MKKRNWDFLVYVHCGLLLWALLFIVSLYIPDGGKTAGVLGIGNTLFLLVNIPLAVFSFVLKAKGCFRLKCGGLVVVLSILNIIVGLAVWRFLILVLQMP